jgi:hypothetical protein
VECPRHIRRAASTQAKHRPARRELPEIEGPDDRGDLTPRAIRIERMRRFLGSALAAGVLLTAWAAVAGGATVLGRTHSVVIRARAGAGLSRGGISEPAGVIRVFRVVAPVGVRVRVTAAISGLAAVSLSIPGSRVDGAETCTRRAGSISCSQGEEACPMPAATWRFRVRKTSGPAGSIRIEFVVGPEHAG